MVEPSNVETPVLKVEHFPIAGDKAVYVNYQMEMTHAKFDEVTGAGQANQRSSKGKFLICCFDKSGSMSGAPFRALKEGALMLGETVFDGDNFEGVITMFFDDRCDFDESRTFEQYKQMLDRHNIRGGTSFYPVIEQINQVVRVRDVSDLTVIFFTDG